jgi:hypothetical protein
LRRTKGGAKNFGVFRVKNHDFTPKNHIFSNFRGARAPISMEIEQKSQKDYKTILLLGKKIISLKNSL